MADDENETSIPQIFKSIDSTLYVCRDEPG